MHNPSSSVCHLKSPHTSSDASSALPNMVPKYLGMEHTCIFYSPSTRLLRMGPE